MRNVLFITADQLRFDCLGFKNGFPVKTPNIDELARRGTVFDKAYCSYPMCVPARASIMNGLNCYDHGVYYNDQAWSDDIATLPGELSKNGYYTVSCGKMHFMPKRKHFGFDKRIADNSSDYKLYLERLGLEENKPEITCKQDAYDWTFRDMPTNIPLEHYLPVYTTNCALHELDLISKRRECLPGGNEPFFMWYSFLLPHVPCCPPEPYFSMYKAEDMPPMVRDESEIETFSKHVNRWKGEWEFIDDEHAQKLRAQYLGCITLVDEMIGKVIDKLKDMGVYDNTLIVLTSDHGDYMGDHYMQQKAFFHDCSSRIPFIFSGPDIPQGEMVSELSGHIDIMPTILDYCGFTLDTPGRKKDMGRTDSISLMPVFNGESISDDRIFVSESGIYGYSIMLRQRNIKINYYEESGEFDMFDLDKDPNELDNKGKDLTMDTIPEDFRAVLKDILVKKDKYKGMDYYHNRKLRKMFS